MVPTQTTVPRGPDAGGKIPSGTCNSCGSGLGSDVSTLVSRLSQDNAPRAFGAPAGTIAAMCRSIKRLREGDVPATDVEIREAALQFVRKVSGYRAPSRRNEAAFNEAVEEVADASRRLIAAVTRT
jgi:hypothetical protein